jgi:hypothetical protein
VSFFSGYTRDVVLPGVGTATHLNVLRNFSKSSDGRMSYINEDSKLRKKDRDWKR